MKNILLSTVAWVNRIAKVAEEQPVLVQEVVPLAMAPGEPTIETEAPAKPVKPYMPSILYTGGPELSISIRGKNVYGTCPQCQAMWNVRERLLRHKLTRTDDSKALTCPACDHAVGLPASVDLRRLT